MKMTDEELLEISEARHPLAVRRLKGEHLTQGEITLLEELDNKLNVYYNSLRPHDPRAGELRTLLDRLSNR